MCNYEQAFWQKLCQDRGSAVQCSRACIFFPEFLYLLTIGLWWGPPPAVAELRREARLHHGCDAAGWGQLDALRDLQRDTPCQRRGWARSPQPCRGWTPQPQAPANPGATQFTRELTRPSRRCSPPCVAAVTHLIAVGGDAPGSGGERSTEQVNPAKEHSKKKTTIARGQFWSGFLVLQRFTFWNF